MNSSVARELNLDGLVGPTHNYAGLSFGNLASAKHGLSVSRPKQAALEGLAKMKFVASLGVPQAVLPPQPRPDLKTLRRLGFSGSDADVIEKAYRDAPRLLAAVYSSSAMWTANAATVSPGADTADGRVHFTPANLVSQFHRSLEPHVTSRVLRQIFPDPDQFSHHDPLPSAPFVADEGAANHMRLSASHRSSGVEIFVYGVGAPGESAPAKFPARQTLEASRAVARLHHLNQARTLFVRQSPAAVDAGAFHNDVVAVANENVLFFHASAYADAPDVSRQLKDTCDFELHLIEVPESRVPLTDAVETYLFNSQLVTVGEGKMALIAPVECQERPRVKAYVDELIAADNPIVAAHYIDVRQSMKNGGGPACLRLRAVLTEEQLAHVHPGVVLTDALYTQLVTWVEAHYREELGPEDLRDPSLAREAHDALEKLESILGIALEPSLGQVPPVPSPAESRVSQHRP
jgi:succinylarginine dihydrolase